MVGTKGHLHFIQAGRLDRMQRAWNGAAGVASGPNEMELELLVWFEAHLD